MQNIELLQKLSESRELVAKGQTKVDDQKSQIDQVTANLEKLAKQKLLLKELTESTLALDVEEKRHDDLLRRKAQLATKLEESEHEVKESAEELHEAQQLDAKATKLKAENDENHNLIVVPGRVELCDIAEKKENLAKLIEETQKTNSDLEISEKESLASKLETKRMALEELAVLEKEVQSVKAKMAFVDKTNKESKEILKREIEEHVSLEKNLRAAVDAKHAHLEEMRETQSKHLRQSIDEATLVAEKEKEKDERLISILRAGMELFNKTEKRLELLGETLDI